MIRVVAIFFMSTLTGCSTYVENEASAEFQPVLPQENSDMRPTGGSIYLPGVAGLFAVEKRASKVGDVLTVALNESFQATKSQSASAAKTDSTAAELPGFLDFIVDPSFGSEQAFAGSGAAAQSNSFTGLVTVSVVQVFQNGNLQLLGQKKLTFNNGDEYVRVSGIVRQDDISPRNVVNSNRLANAEITYIGAGDVADTAKRGLLPRLLSAINPV
jgi:flagellar L-ring protein precursor FlgH